MILITGSTGHLGEATIDFLLKKIPVNNIAALARDTEKATGLKAKGIDIRIGDYENYVSMLEAFKGIDKLLLISSSDLHDRAAHHINAINAAKEAGIKHVLYTSIDIKDLHHSAVVSITESHAKTIAHLKGSGLKYTLFNNNLYADVLPMFMGENVLETGIFFPAGNGKAPYASRLNFAEAIANVLAEDGHENKEYVMHNTEKYSLQDVAATLSKISTKRITYTSPTAEVYTDALNKAGVPAGYVAMFVGFAEAIKQGEFDTDATDLEKLLGRKPATLEDYLAEIYGTKN